MREIFSYLWRFMHAFWLDRRNIFDVARAGPFTTVVLFNYADVLFVPQYGKKQ